MCQEESDCVYTRVWHETRARDAVDASEIFHAVRIEMKITSERDGNRSSRPRAFELFPLARESSLASAFASWRSDPKLRDVFENIYVLEACSRLGLSVDSLRASRK